MSAVHRDATLVFGLQFSPAIERAFFRPETAVVVSSRSVWAREICG